MRLKKLSSRYEKKCVWLLSYLLFASCLLLSCSDNSVQSEEVIEIENREQTVSYNGGTLKSTDNVITLNIPAGAVEQETTIGISNENKSIIPTIINGESDGSSYKLEPSGLEFNEPIEVTINLNGFFNEFDPETSAILHWNDKQKKYDLVTANVNQKANQATLQINSFSYLSPIKNPDKSSGWQVFNVKWDIPVVNWYNDLDNSNLSDPNDPFYKDSDYQQAFKQWAIHSGITFHQVNSIDEAQIVVRQYWGDLDECPYYTMAEDAIGTICYDEEAANGDTVLDDSNQVQIMLNNFNIMSETWNSEDAKESILLHEIGHAIGIAHPAFCGDGLVPCSDGMIMRSGTPYYFKLQSADIEAVQYHYGDNQDTFKACGDILSDVEGNKYETVQIGEQCWMAENLNTSMYRDGTIIPNVQERDDWMELDSAAWAYYRNSAKHGSKYGKLYNRYTLNNNSELCPSEWKIPSTDDWKTLVNYLGGVLKAAKKLKSTSWQSDSGHYGTNESGFNGLQAGLRTTYYGAFTGLNEGAYWHSATHKDTNHSFWLIDHNHYVYYSEGGFMLNGLSVRCILE